MLNSIKWNVLLYPFIALSAIGLVLSVAAHLASVMGIDLNLGEMVWLLHTGIFVVWLPTVLTSIMTTSNLSFKKNDFWKFALRGCPKWMKIMTLSFFGYGIFNFIFFALTEGRSGIPREETGPQAIRGFSGHWMIFYSAAFSILYSASKVKEVDAARKCINGHHVPPMVNYCEECGSRIP